MEDGSFGKRWMMGMSKEISHPRSCSDPSLLPKPDDVHIDLGAGANAGSSRGGMKFAAMDPLSELVWSPQSGLSLRCADCSFTGKRKLLSPAFGMGFSNMVTPQRSRSNDETGFHVNFQLRTGDISDRTEAPAGNRDCCRSSEMDRPLSGTGDCMEDENTGASLPAPKMIEKEDMLEYKVEKRDGEDGKQAETEDGASGRLLDNPSSIGGKTGTLLASETLRVEDAPSAIAVEKEDGDKMKRADCVNASNLEILESTAENDLPTIAGSGSKALRRDECRGDKVGYLPDETDAEKASSPRRPPTDSGSHKYLAKGKEKEDEKEKAISDGNINGRTWKDINDDESFGSVESCNSAGLHTRGKKRPNIEQQIITGSKRLKMQIRECPGSASKLRQDSSFMNWISNMMKGFWKANEGDGSPPGAFTVTDTNDHGNGFADQHSALCWDKVDSECRNTGFQSFFQSIYCPRRRIQDADMDLRDEECDTNVATLSCHGKLPNFQDQFLIMNENHVSSGNEIGLVAEPNASSGKVAITPANEAVSSENKNSCNHESYTDKQRKDSPSSQSKSKPNEDRTICPEPDGKEIQTFTNRKGALRSLWITRFSVGNSCLQSYLHHDRVPTIDVKVQEADESATVVVKTRDSQKTTKEDCASACASAVDGYGNSNLLHNLNPVVSSPRIESSEALASLFARRLDAIKHIMPSDLAENVDGSATLTCFYCGKKGHHLRDCSEVTDNELGDLMRNISAQNGRDKASSGLCIRCFQLNHWAATCPNAPQRHSRAEGNKSSRHFGIADVLASTSGAKFFHHDSIDKQAIDVPKAIFDAVRVLRLSRTDILKWMNSKTSISNLEGFFLRLRLGKWEEGLGGTGYYVACIKGTVEDQSSRRGSRNSISVEVGGTTCLVEPQYISNHDFLEEEVKAWWRTTAKSGGSVLPSGDELGRKIRQRKMLSF